MPCRASARALKAVAACGLHVSRFGVHPDGKLVIWVDEVEEPERDYLAEWQSKRARRDALKPPDDPPVLPSPRGDADPNYDANRSTKGNAAGRCRRRSLP